MKLELTNIGSDVNFKDSVTYYRINSGEDNLKGFRNRLIFYLR